jgi:predicted  nucleic acid-binding Zn-ribbon protein
MENKPIEYEHRITAVEDRALSNTHRLDEVEKRQADLEELTTSVKVLAAREEVVERDVKEIKDDVKSLTDKPAKRWEKVVEILLTVIIGGVVGYILAQAGLQ